MNIFRKENLRDLSGLLIAWARDNADLKSRLASEFNIIDIEKIIKLSEFQTLKVFHEIMAIVKNDKTFLYGMNSNIIRTLLEIYCQESAQALIMANVPHFLDLASKILLIYPENEEELYTVLASTAGLAEKFCPFTLIQENISASQGVNEEVVESLLKSAIRFKKANFKCVIQNWKESLSFSFYEYFARTQATRSKILCFLLITHILNLSSNETPFLLAHLYQIQPDTTQYEIFVNECETLCQNELFFLPGEYTENLLNQKGDKEGSEIGMEAENVKRINSSDVSSEKLQSESSNTVLTSQFLQNCDKLLKALHAANFVTINGETGCGKSTSIEFLASLKSRSHKLIRVYTDETTDLNSLIGNYTCTEKIGEFEWKNGPLINAMSTGSWLVFENFQEANPELLNNLLLIERNGGLRTESYAGFVKAELGFKLIAVTNFGVHFRGMVANENEILLKEKSYFVDLNTTTESWALNITEISRKLFENTNANPNNIVVYEYLSALIEIFAWARRERMTLPVHYRGLHLDSGQVIRLVKRFSFQIKVVYGEGGLANRHPTEDFRKNLLLEVVDVVFGRYKDSLELFPELWEKIFSAFKIFGKDGEQFIREVQVKVEKSTREFRIGRLGEIKLNEFKTKDSVDEPAANVATPVVYNSYSNKIIERLTSCLLFNESCLLVGDTGCGKTTISQHVAEIFGKKLYVYNLNQGSDTIDLVGGFKPVDLKLLLKNILVKYVKNLLKIVSEKSNEKFLQSLRELYTKRNYNTLMKSMLESYKLIREKLNKMEDSATKQTMEKKWDQLEARIKNIYINREKFDSNLAFQFLQGNLVKALKNGDWILIDEINLANNEVLQKLLPIIEGQSLLLYEKGDVKEIKRNPGFRLIGCMNPGSDIGKKELPANVRAKFTELFIPDLEEKSELHKITERTLGSTVSREVVEKLVDVYLWLREKSKNFEIEDGYNKRPHFSLRNMSRCLRYIKVSLREYGLERTIYEGINIGFGSILSSSSKVALEKEIERQFGVNSVKYLKLVKQFNKTIVNHTVFFGFKIKTGPLTPKTAAETDFEVTPTFENYLIQLLSVISSTDHPILLEGPTSSGKTSMINFLAKIAGYRCVRINNHNHTEIEEYIGTYLPDSKGKLVFQEGILIEALRNGYWIILDELNLARSEILESLNRLLDDNKELFVPELQIHIKPHENFRLFATQNPTHYSGRKELSKAFKNRFIQIYFDDISDFDLEKIINKKCNIAPSYCKKLIKTMKDLQLQRQTNKFFQGKDSSITVRDLIKWAKRPHTSQEELAMEGYCLLAERLRSGAEREEVQKIIEKNFKCKLEPDSLYLRFTNNPEFIKSREALESTLSNKDGSSHGIASIQWNLSFRRMATLVMKCIQNKEPVLLIGETGCGKTTLCQLLAMLYEIGFYSINCHHYTESIDFLGSLRPVRNRDEITKTITDLERQIQELEMESTEVPAIIEAIKIKELTNEKKIRKLTAILDKVKKESALYSLVDRLIVNLTKEDSLFEWQDGPLVEAMRRGGIFLIDEISLADDSVLERLNSVLEPERGLTLSEKPDNIEEIIAVDKFFILATMNPGGDFGKRELSPALRNRFTEIWVEPITAQKYIQIDFEKMSDVVLMTRGAGGSFLSLVTIGNECYKMIYENLLANRKINFNETDVSREEVLAELAWCVYSFLRYFNCDFCDQYLSDKKHLSLRDILTLASFIENANGSPLKAAFLNGLYVMIIDSLGMQFSTQEERAKINRELSENLDIIINQTRFMISGRVSLRTKESNMSIESSEYVIDNFRVSINKKKTKSLKRKFAVSNEIVQTNLSKLARALQISKSILLEGQPGVGKSSLIEYLAHETGNKLLRINLSEQTDLIDLLGCDVPHHEQKDSQNKTAFRWADGLLLQAMKKGHWLMLEELNLANQTVLEGLNAILDHRGTVFIPELSCEFTKHPKFRIFASQNPIQQGGGRKGLPASFLNRFTKVFIEEATSVDQLQIISELYSEINAEILVKLVDFTKGLTSLRGLHGSLKGNLRDLIRFCELYNTNEKDLQGAFELVYLNQLPLANQVEVLIYHFETIFGVKFDLSSYLQLPILKVFKDRLEIEISSYSSTTDNTTITTHQVRRHHIGQSFQSKNEDLMILNKDLTVFKHLLRVLPQPWPILITGPRGSGRSSSVKLLAQLTGKRLVSIQLNSSTDSTDLIGNYNQNDTKRQILSLINELKEWAYSLIKSMVLNNGQQIVVADFMMFGQLCQEFVCKCIVLREACFKAEQDFDYKTELAPLSNFLNILRENQNQLRPIFEDLETKIEFYLQKLQTTLNGLSQQTIFFSWFDSQLIKAAKEGHWVLLEDVGKCNSAILERINPLLESSGVLYITEHALSNSKSLKITPHPEFKLFLALDEAQKLSDPLRNRCIELNLRVPRNDSFLKQDQNEDTYQQKLNNSLKLSYEGDLRKLVRLAGIRISVIEELLVALDAEFYNEVRNSAGGSLNGKQIGLFVVFLKRFMQSQRENTDLYYALKQSFSQVYGKYLVKSNPGSLDVFWNTQMTNGSKFSQTLQNTVTISPPQQALFEENLLARVFSTVSTSPLLEKLYLIEKLPVDGQYWAQRASQIILGSGYESVPINQAMNFVQIKSCQTLLQNVMVFLRQQYDLGKMTDGEYNAVELFVQKITEQINLLTRTNQLNDKVLLVLHSICSFLTHNVQKNLRTLDKLFTILEKKVMKYPRQPQGTETKEISLASLLWFRSSFRQTMPKHPVIFQSIRQLLYLVSEIDSPFYIKYRGASKEIVEYKTKLNDLLFSDEDFTKRSFGLFGIILNNFCKLSRSQATNLIPSLNLLIQGYFKEIDERYPLYQQVKQAGELNIIEEYDNQVLKAIKVFDEAYLKAILKIEIKDGELLLFIEHLRLEALVSFCNILMKETLSAFANNSQKVDFARLWKEHFKKGYEPEIFDLGLSEGLKLHLSYSMSTGLLTIEEIIELYVRIEVDRIAIRRKMVAKDLEIEDIATACQNLLNLSPMKNAYIDLYLKQTIYQCISDSLQLHLLTRSSRINTEVSFMILWISKCLFVGENALLNITRALRLETEGITIKSMERILEVAQDEILIQEDDPKGLVNKRVIEMFKTVLVQETQRGLVDWEMKRQLAKFIWSLFDFSASKESVFAFFKTQLSSDLISYEVDNLTERLTAFFNVNQMVFCTRNSDLAENARLSSAIDKLKIKKEKKESDVVIRSQQSDSNIGIYSEFHDQATPRIKEITRMLVEATNLTNPEGFSAIVFAWIDNAYQEYFFSFKDILIPLMFSAFNLIPPSNKVQQENKVNEMNSSKQTLVMKSSELLLLTERSLRNALVSKDLEKDTLYKLVNMASMAANFTTIKADASWEKRFHIPFFTILLESFHSHFSPKEEEDEEDIDPRKNILQFDRAVQYINFQKQIGNMVVDEYTKKAVEFHKQQEELEIEERFHNKENKQGLVELAGKQSIRDILQEVDKIGQRVQEKSKKKHSYDKLFIDIVHSLVLKVPAKRQDFHSNFLALTLDAFANKKSHAEKDFPISWINFGLSVKTLLEYIAGGKTGLSDGGFYEAENLPEMSSLFFVLEKILKRCKELLDVEMFACHPMLQNIAVSTDYIEGLPLHFTSIPRVLPVLSHLLQKMEEWNQFVRSDFRMVEQYEELRVLVLRWRKSERESWRILLKESERKIQEKEASLLTRLVMYLYREKDPKRTFTLGEEFIRRSNFATFEIRLKLLDFICKLIKNNPDYNEVQDSKVISILRGIYDFYSLFFDFWVKKREETSKQMEKQIKEFITLSRWDSHDYLTLRIHVEKYHRKLNTIAKRYEELLEEPLELTVLKPFRANYLTESIAHFAMTYTPEFKALATTELNPKSYRPLVVNDIHRHLNFSKEHETLGLIHKNWIRAIFPVSEHKFKKLLPQSLKSSLEAHRKQEGSVATTQVTQGEEEDQQGLYSLKDHLKDSINSFFRRMENLREEGISKSTKSKGFQDLLKFLKSLGINDSAFKEKVEFDELQNEKFVDDIRSLTLSLFAPDGKELARKLNDSCNKLHKYVRKSKDYHNVLRSDKNFSPEISMVDLRRSHGFIASLWAYSSLMRAALISLMEKAANIVKTQRQIEYIEQTLQEGIKAESDNQEVKFLKVSPDVQRILKTTQNEKDDVLLQLDQLENIVSRLKLEISEPIKNKVQELRTIIREVSLLVEPCVDYEILSVSFFESILARLVQIRNIFQTIQELVTSDPDSDSLLRGVLDSFSQLTKLSYSSHVRELEGLLTRAAQTQELIINVNDVDVFQTSVSHTGLYIQSMAKQQAKYAAAVPALLNVEDAVALNSKSARKTLVDNEKHQWTNLSKNMDFLSSKMTIDQLFSQDYFRVDTTAVDSLRKLNASSKIASMIVKASCLYVFQTQKTLEKLNYLVSTVIFNLTYKGFCSPKEQEEDDGEGKGDFSMADGTGMGEGQGMENVSKEIEFEEQVLGERQDEEDVLPQDEKDLKEEKEGMEMENEFEGKNYDKEKNPEDEMDGESNNPDDFQDEFSDVEQDFDYKMWHDEKEEQKKDEEEDGGADQDENLSMSEEEKLEFHDEEEKGETEARAKQDKHKDKSEKRQAKDYDAFKQDEDDKEKDEINEMDSEDADDNDEEEKKKEDYRRGKEEESKEEGEDKDKEKQQEENSLQLSDGDDKVEFESEHEDDLEKDENKSAVDDTGADDDAIDEERPPEPESKKQEPEEDKQDMDIENEANENENKDGKEIEEESEEEETNEKEKDFTSRPEQKKNKDQKKPEMSKKGFKNETQQQNNKEGEENEDENEGAGEDEEEKPEGQTGGEEAVQLEEKKNKNEDFLKKLIENISNAAMNEEQAEDLENFMRDLNITRENMEEQDVPQNQQLKQQIMEDPNMAENMMFEAVQNNQSENAKNSLKTNAPSSMNPGMQLNSSKMDQEDNNNKDLMSDMNPEMTTEEENFDKPATKDAEKDNDSKNNSKNPKTTDKTKTQQQLPSRDRKSLVEEAQAKQIEKIIEESERQEERDKEQFINKMEVENPKKPWQKPQAEQAEELAVPTLQTRTHQELKEQLDDLVSQWKLDSLNQEEGLKVWNQLENSSRNQATHLCEELRAVLEPTQVAGLKGDYKSGKRLNMKKIIPYIASNFRKDKIWLRRSDPNKRNFQINLAIDDSLSMSEQNVGFFALESLTMMALAMSRLEIGQLAISGIKQGLELLHPFDKPLTSNEGPYILSQFKFRYYDENSSDLSMTNFLRQSIDLFKEWKEKDRSAEQICFIISDGRLNKNLLRPLVREAEENGQVYIFIILDKKEAKESVLNIKSYKVDYVDGKSVMKMSNYLDDFPFKYYLVLHDLTLLPKVLVDILRQYFENLK